MTKPPQPIDEANPLYEQIEKLFDLRINNTGNEIHISFGAKGVWVEYERFSKLRDSIEQLCRLNAAQAVTAALKRTWWVTNHDTDTKMAGPFTTLEDAALYRQLLERNNSPITYWLEQDTNELSKWEEA